MKVGVVGTGPPKAGRGRKYPPLEPLEGGDPTDTKISDFSLASRLGETQSLLFKVTLSVARVTATPGSWYDTPAPCVWRRGRADHPPPTHVPPIPATLSINWGCG